MKPISIKYGRLINTGNYENERLELEVEIEEGDTAAATVAAAKTFVHRHLRSPDDEQEIRKAQRVLDHPDDFTGRELKAAQEVIARATAPEDALPF